MLDTNMVSDLANDAYGRVSRSMDAQRDAWKGASLIVAAEARFGAAKRGSASLTSRLEGALARLVIAPLQEPFDRRYAQLRADRERRGTPLAANDLRIAAHALTLDCVLVTDDQAFTRVPGLVVENWLRG